MPTHRPSPVHSAQRLALPLLVLGAVLISASGIYVKLSEVGPTTTGFYRMFLSMPIYAVVLLIAGNRRTGQAETALPPISRRAWWALWVSGFFLALDLIAWHWSMHYISVAAATLLGCTAPVWVALMGFLFFGERFSARFLIGLTIAMIGVGFLVLGGATAFKFTDGLGVACGLLAAVCYAFYIRGVKAARDSLRVSQMMFWNAVIASTILLPIAGVTESGLLPHSWKGWGAVIGVAVTSQVIGQGLIGWSMAHLSAAFSSLTLLLTPVASAVLAWLTLGETLTALQIGGGVGVLAGITLAKPLGRPAPRAADDQSDAAKPPKRVAA
ncbi:MAG TPA: DMT family transporter [Terriglobia bacterium]|nr:DMT family transporter [Terriglobia bacterium]